MDVSKLPEFQELLQKRKALMLPLSLVMLVGYFGFILLVAFDPALLNEKIGGGSTSLGILMGLGLILLSLVVTGFFVHRSNMVLEKLVETIQAKAAGR